jgi:hypothetical protein
LEQARDTGTVQEPDAGSVQERAAEPGSERAAERELGADAAEAAGVELDGLAPVSGPALGDLAPGAGPELADPEPDEVLESDDQERGAAPAWDADAAAVPDVVPTPGVPASARGNRL